MRIAGTFLLLCALAACAEQPKRETWAVAIRIEPHASPKWDTDEVVVTARAESGVMGTKSVLKARLNCHVGDTVHASIQGLTLTLDDRACVKQGAFAHANATTGL